MSYEEYISALVPKDREYDRYAGAWNEMLAEGFDACLGLGLIYKSITGKEAFTGDLLTEHEMSIAGVEGAISLTASIALAAYGASSVGGFFGMLFADAAGGFLGGAAHSAAIYSGMSERDAFILSMIIGMASGGALENAFSKSPSVIDDLAKRFGKSSDEMAEMMGSLTELAAKYNYTSVDDLLRHIDDLPTGVYDDIVGILDKPLGSFDLKRESQFFKNGQTDEVVEEVFSSTRKSELTRLRTIREELPPGSKYQGTDAFGNPVGNVAYSTSEITNYNIPEMKSHSRIGSSGKNGIKNPVDGWVSNVENPRYADLVERVDRNNQINPNGTLRNNDTEYKLIENYNRILGGDSSASGTINIISERPVCPSCEKVIKAFSADYPNIEIHVMDSTGNSYSLLGGKIKN